MPSKTRVRHKKLDDSVVESLSLLRKIKYSVGTVILGIFITAARVARNDPDTPEYQISWRAWTFLAGCSTVHLYVLHWLFEQSVRTEKRDEKTESYISALRTTAAIFTVVCAYRSYVPLAYTDCNCFFDSKIFVPAVARMFAFTAEVCVAVLFARVNTHIVEGIYFWHYDHGENNREFKYRPKKEPRRELTWWIKLYYETSLFFCRHVIVPALTLANVFCCTGCFTQNKIFFFCEEAMWALVGFAGMFIVPFGLLDARQIRPAGKASNDWNSAINAIWLTLTACVVMWVFIVFHDLPVIWANWKKQPSPWEGNAILPGVAELFTCRNVSRKWGDVKFYFSWQGPYFTCAVWAVLIFAVTAPGYKLFEQKTTSGSKKKTSKAKSS